MENSKISWTTHTQNFWWGCEKIAPGCARCYAADLAKRAGKEWGRAAPRYMTSFKNWREPYKWNLAAEKAGVRARVFCQSMSDLFEDHSGPVLDFKGVKRAYKFEGGYSWHGKDANVCLDPITLDDLRREAFEVVDATPWLDWLLLTKRPENIWRMWEPTATKPLPDRPVGLRESPHPQYRANVWLGASPSDQETTEILMPELRKCRDLCAIRFLSCEPLLDSIDLSQWLAIEPDRNGSWRRKSDLPCEPDIDFVIIGGESGPRHRPCEITWIEELVDQCHAAGVAVWVKQDAALHPGQQGRIPDSLFLHQEPTAR